MTTTGPELREEHVLRDGTRVTLRHIVPEDAAELARGFARLSPTSRYRRFFGGVRVLSDDMLRYLTRVDGRDHVAIVAVTRAGKGGEQEAETGLGVARFVRRPDDPTTADVAITVVDDAQGKGLGHLLSRTLARAARERGIERFRGEILEDNGPVRQLLAEAGAVVQRAQDGCVAFDVELDHTEPHAADERIDLAARRLLRAAASFLVGSIRSLRLPGSHEHKG